MFDVKSFSNVLQKITNTYTSISEFAENSEVNRTYLSKYINMKLNNPPTPKILEKIANASNGLIAYAQLMEICGYIDVAMDVPADLIKQKVEYIIKNESSLLSIGLTKQQIIKLQDIVSMDMSSKEYQTCLNNLLENLTLEQSYNVLKILQNMIYEIKKDSHEKIVLAESLQNEAEEFINNVRTIKELNAIKQKYNKNQYYMCPVYGQISAGQPNWAEENIEGRIPIDVNLMNIVNPEEHFFLHVNR